MDPDEFREIVRPQILAAWDKKCFCARPGFRKLVSFNFRDYDIGPVGLSDSHILIREVIGQRCSPRGETTSFQGETTQDYVCRQCGASCTERFADFSISMYQTSVTYNDMPTVAPRGLYLIGFYGFERDDFRKITDFERVSTAEDFLAQLHLP